MNQDCAVILLNYNNWEETLKCVNRLKKINVDESNIIIVDNHSTDDSLAHIEKGNHEFILIKAKKNKGYAAGNNVGIRLASEKGYKYACVMNCDISFSSDFISPLLSRLKENRQIGIIGPVVCKAGSKKVASAGGKINFFLGKSIFNFQNSQYKDRGMLEVDYISGGCLIFGIDNLSKVGLIPEAYFLNFEDNEVCVNLRKQKMKVICDTSVKIYHEGESSIGKIMGMQEYFLLRNRVIFEKRNANLLQKTIFFAYLILTVLKNCFVKNKSQHFKAYWDGLVGKNKYDYLIR